MPRGRKVNLDKPESMVKPARFIGALQEGQVRKSRSLNVSRLARRTKNPEVLAYATNEKMRRQDIAQKKIGRTIGLTKGISAMEKKAQREAKKQDRLNMKLEKKLEKQRIKEQKMAIRQQIADLRIQLKALK